jgi:hypothetical protein
MSQAELEEKRKARMIFKLRKAKIADSGELILPNGNIVGHRDYQIYYK